MRHMLIVLGIVVAAIAIGAGLYVYGPAAVRETPQVPATEAAAVVVAADAALIVPFSVIAEGTDAAVTVRKNYAVYDKDGFARLWTMTYGEDAPAAPSIDFDATYVIGVFAGEKSSGGYGIQVQSVTDEDAIRNITIALKSPAAGCMATQALTRPYQIITVPFSTREITRTDIAKEIPCN